MYLDITLSCCGYQILYHEILQRYYRKMTKKWSFSYEFSSITLFTYNIPMDPKLWFDALRPSQKLWSCREGQLT